MKKFFGWFFIVVGVGGIIKHIAKASDNVPGAFSDVGFTIAFLGIGIFLLSTVKPQKDNTNLPDNKKGTDLTK